MTGYHVIRIAVDAAQQTISATIECVEHAPCVCPSMLDVGPFDRPEEMLLRALDTLPRQLLLW